ncbi:MAG TPA: hypothetical protein VGZ32_21515, partial [Actinocrinis sp.]|nr:hypothetical protein [Actinocrinis sp.]
MADAMSGPAGEQFHALISQIGGMAPQMVAGAQQVGDMAKSTAVQTQYSKLMILLQLIWMAEQIIEWSTTVWGLAVAVEVEAIGRLVVAQIAKRFLVTVVSATAIQTGMDALVQAFQMFVLHDRTKWDTSSTVGAAEMGAVGGAVGGVLHEVGHALAPDLIKTTVGRIGMAGATGLATGLVSNAAFGGSQDLGLAVTAGIAGGLFAGREGQHGIAEHPAEFLPGLTDKLARITDDLQTLSDTSDDGEKPSGDDYYTRPTIVAAADEKGAVVVEREPGAELGRVAAPPEMTATLMDTAGSPTGEARPLQTTAAAPMDAGEPPGLAVKSLETSGPVDAGELSRRPAGLVGTVELPLESAGISSTTDGHGPAGEPTSGFDAGPGRAPTGLPGLAADAGLLRRGAEVGGAAVLEPEHGSAASAEPLATPARADVAARPAVTGTTAGLPGFDTTSHTAHATVSEAEHAPPVAVRSAVEYRPAEAPIVTLEAGPGRATAGHAELEAVSGGLESHRGGLESDRAGSEAGPGRVEASGDAVLPGSLAESKPTSVAGPEDALALRSTEPDWRVPTGEREEGVDGVEGGEPLIAAQASAEQDANLVLESELAHPVLLESSPRFEKWPAAGESRWHDAFVAVAEESVRRAWGPLPVTLDPGADPHPAFRAVRQIVADLRTGDVAAGDGRASVMRDGDAPSAYAVERAHALAGELVDGLPRPEPRLLGGVRSGAQAGGSGRRADGRRGDGRRRDAPGSSGRGGQPSRSTADPAMADTGSGERPTPGPSGQALIHQPRTPEPSVPQPRGRRSRAVPGRGARTPAARAPRYAIQDHELLGLIDRLKENNQWQDGLPAGKATVVDGGLTRRIGRTLLDILSLDAGGDPRRVVPHRVLEQLIEAGLQVPADVRDWYARQGPASGVQLARRVRQTQTARRKELLRRREVAPDGPAAGREQRVRISDRELIMLIERLKAEHPSAWREGRPAWDVTFTVGGRVRTLGKVLYSMRSLNGVAGPFRRMSRKMMDEMTRAGFVIPDEVRAWYEANPDKIPADEEASDRSGPGDDAAGAGADGEEIRRESRSPEPPDDIPSPLGGDRGVGRDGGDGDGPRPVREPRAVSPGDAAARVMRMVAGVGGAQARPDPARMVRFLEERNLRQVPIVGDGDCFFNALRATAPERIDWHDANDMRAQLATALRNDLELPEHERRLWPHLDITAQAGATEDLLRREPEAAARSLAQGAREQDVWNEYFQRVLDNWNEGTRQYLVRRLEDPGAWDDLTGDVAPLAATFVWGLRIVRLDAAGRVDHFGPEDGRQMVLVRYEGALGEGLDHWTGTEPAEADRGAERAPQDGGRHGDVPDVSRPGTGGGRLGPVDWRDLFGDDFEERDDLFRPGDGIRDDEAMDVDAPVDASGPAPDVHAETGAAHEGSLIRESELVGLVERLKTWNSAGWHNGRPLPDALVPDEHGRIRPIGRVLEQITRDQIRPVSRDTRDRLKAAGLQGAEEAMLKYDAPLLGGGIAEHELAELAEELQRTDEEAWNDGIPLAPATVVDARGNRRPIGKSLYEIRSRDPARGMPRRVLAPERLEELQRAGLRGLETSLEWSRGNYLEWSRDHPLDSRGRHAGGGYQIRDDELLRLIDQLKAEDKWNDGAPTSRETVSENGQDRRIGDALYKIRRLTKGGAPRRRVPPELLEQLRNAGLDIPRNVLAAHRRGATESRARGVGLGSGLRESRRTRHVPGQIRLEAPPPQPAFGRLRTVSPPSDAEPFLGLPSPRARSESRPEPLFLPSPSPPDVERQPSTPIGGDRGGLRPVALPPQEAVAQVLGWAAGDAGRGASLDEVAGWLAGWRNLQPVPIVEDGDCFFNALRATQPGIFDMRFPAGMRWQMAERLRRDLQEPDQRRRLYWPELDVSAQQGRTEDLIRHNSADVARFMAEGATAPEVWNRYSTWVRLNWNDVERLGVIARLETPGSWDDVSRVVAPLAAAWIWNLQIRQVDGVGRVYDLGPADGAETVLIRQAGALGAGMDHWTGTAPLGQRDDGGMARGPGLDLAPGPRADRSPAPGLRLMPRPDAEPGPPPVPTPGWSAPPGPPPGWVPPLGPPLAPEPRWFPPPEPPPWARPVGPPPGWSAPPASQPRWPLPPGPPPRRDP